MFKQSRFIYICNFGTDISALVFFFEGEGGCGDFCYVLAFKIRTVFLAGKRGGGITRSKVNQTFTYLVSLINGIHNGHFVHLYY